MPALRAELLEEFSQIGSDHVSEGIYELYSGKIQALGEGVCHLLAPQWQRSNNIDNIKT